MTTCSTCYVQYRDRSATGAAIPCPVCALREEMDRRSEAASPAIAAASMFVKYGAAPASPSAPQPCGKLESDGGGVCDLPAGHEGACGQRIDPQGHRRWFAPPPPSEQRCGENERDACTCLHWRVEHSHGPYTGCLVPGCKCATFRPAREEDKSHG